MDGQTAEIIRALDDIGNEMASRKNSLLFVVYSILVTIRNLLENMSDGNMVQFSFSEDIKLYLSREDLFGNKIKRTIKETESNIDRLLLDVRSWEISTGLEVCYRISPEDFKEFQNLGSKIDPYYSFLIHNPEKKNSRYIWEKFQQLAMDIRKNAVTNEDKSIFEILERIRDDIRASSEVKYLVQQVFFSVPKGVPLELMKGVSEIFNGKYNSWVIPYLEFCIQFHLLGIVTS
ncbi:uncharacterized protein Eint_051210 [Encephalitozoon intestinalis ATCC 50506]|uniref:Uncharacterized protein n=1 Tax=Encephalitozoon intestinalis (strain ATCC 50506) TaxID=876142 RepID=E0S6Y2_ENCIT|nr:uncharacterized protein Eint_051210 [Encephalitozoon intestinalis ATCC 50506]ADM11568.1 hypothetical protein Eint_051210 [Encephalitozoon intestinalis ATCC 50506]UTX45284.1 putative reticulocyte binding protein [Encephalitozoon intestinalis]